MDWQSDCLAKAIPERAVVLPRRSLPVRQSSDEHLVTAAKQNNHSAHIVVLPPRPRRAKQSIGPNRVAPAS